MAIIAGLTAIISTIIGVLTFYYTVYLPHINGENTPATQFFAPVLPDSNNQPSSSSSSNPSSSSSSNPNRNSSIGGTTDTTPPEIEDDIRGTRGSNEWYTSDVTVSWTVTDDQSPITSKSDACDQTTTIDQDTGVDGQTTTCQATSSGGTQEASVTIKREATPPVITISSEISNGDSFTVDEFGDSTVPSEPTCEATDDASGVDGECVVLGYSKEAGEHTITFTATDNAGNEATEEISYDVQSIVG